jgi:folate-binding protein YgfZ
MSASFTAETLLIEGPDAVAFAHAQFGSNVNALATDAWQFSAWLDPQGRVRALFHLARIFDDRLLLVLRGGHAAPMANELRRFVFRSRVTLTARSSRALSTGDALPMHTVRHDHDMLSIGCGTHSLQIDSCREGDDRWRLPQLREGWSWLPDQALRELLPSALSLHRLQAVAIDKGCYPGQEIVSRMHYRGGQKRHLHHVELSRPVGANEVLRVETRDVGRLLDIVTSSDGIAALAVLDDEFVAQHAGNSSISLNNNLVLRLCKSWPA